MLSLATTLQVIWYMCIYIQKRSIASINTPAAFQSLKIDYTGIWLSRSAYSKFVVMVNKKIYSQTDYFRTTDFKGLSMVATVPDHQSNKAC